MNQKPNTHPSTERIIDKGWAKMRILLDQHLPSSNTHHHQVSVPFPFESSSTTPIPASQFPHSTHTTNRKLCPRAHATKPSPPLHHQSATQKQTPKTSQHQTMRSRELTTKIALHRSLPLFPSCAQPSIRATTSLSTTLSTG